MGDEQKFWELSQGMSDTVEGIVTAVNLTNRLVTVNTAGVTTVMPWAGAAPWVGDRVRVVTAGLKPVCLLVQGSPMGTVQTTASGKATVTGDDTRSYVYPYLGAAPANGARVRLDHAGRVVLGTYSSEPAGSIVVAPPAPPGGSGVADFRPVWSGNWRGGAFSTANAEISDTRTAAYGFGTQIRDTIPAGRTITAATLTLVQNWDNVPGVPSSLGVHGYDGMPGSFGDGDLTGGFAVGGGSVTFSILGAVADALRAGTAFGVGFRSANGWRQYAAAPNCLIHIEWS